MAQSPAFFPQRPSNNPVTPVHATGEPGRLPGNLTPSQPIPQPGAFPASPMQQASPAQGPHDWTGPKGNAEIKLPQLEQRQKIDGAAVIARRFGENTQIWCGPTLLKDMGRNGADADEIVKAIRELRPTEWCGIGSGGRPVVEYGLTKGEPFSPTFAPKQSIAIDMKTIRAEAIRGTWVLRDEGNILVNFGLQQQDAEQAAAVVQKYGFNRLGTIGNFQYLFAQAGTAPGANVASSGVVKALQEQSLTRTGIDVPGVGFIGERIVLDSKKLEVRKDRGEYTLVHGSDVIAKCGASEWAARDALKLVQEMRFTEFCRVNSEISFFLVNGQAPNRVPFSVQASRFDVETLKVRNASGGQWGIYEGNGRMVFSVTSEKEANDLLKLLKHYRFDQTCQIGLSSRAGLKFLAKSTR